ncbi:NAD-dependent epimerase/dehydratase family protein [Limosilactobacillus pontis]|uniref:NAD-dependent epimerase/dehydratase family protein n=1 Tax=Limosilactobacillus pontis TaxID=35787 RepID=UPI0022485A62|nr:NAD-dependent epimerase/dehydratase family protein [Limosilactobacillus pontis]MCX2187484.1 sugar nucleotide-binding protein [Limosilactobacillus pontis]MCX2189229.1 sugar nucleotide-binding protein [Limosilactobacillus pontis]
MKILVTGANGYLGQGIVEELSRKSNVEVIATGRKVDRINVDVKKSQLIFSRLKIRIITLVGPTFYYI